MPPRTPARRPLRGLVPAICAVTGVEDEVGDVLLPGAFTRTLAARPVKPVFSHEWKDPIGVCHKVEEWMPGDARLPKTTPRGDPWPTEAGALVADVGFNMRTQRGRDVFEQVKQWHEEGGGAQWSIGYVVPKGGATKRSGVRFIHDLTLYEVSPVLHGAHPLTMALEIKSAQGAAAGMEYKATPADAPHGEDQAGQGVMVALYPPPDVAEQIAHPDGTAPEDLHVTLAYLGDAADLGGHPSDLPDAIRDIVAGSPQLQGTIGGIGRFPDGGDGVPVWVPVDVPGLSALQDTIARNLATSVFSEQLHDNHGFTPHLTLGYDLPDDTAAVDATPVVFDQVWVVIGPDKTPIPLGQPTSDQATPPDGAQAGPVEGPADGPVTEVKTARQAVAAARTVSGLEVKTAHQAVMQAKGGALVVTRAVIHKGTPTRPQEKIMTGSMPGSYEEQRGQIASAVRTLFKPNGDGDGDGDGGEYGYVYVEATYPDHVIVSLEKPQDPEPESYSIPYKVEDDEVVLGEPQKVELTVVALPDTDGDADDGGDKEEEAGGDEAQEARFLRPAAEHLNDATSSLAIADVDPAQMEVLRPSLLELLATLSRKGMPIPNPADLLDEEDSPEGDMGWADGWDTPDDAGMPDGPKGAGAADSDAAGDAGADGAPDPDASGDAGVGEDPDAAGDGTAAAGDSPVSLDPEEVKKELEALNA